MARRKPSRSRSRRPGATTTPSKTTTSAASDDGTSTVTDEPGTSPADAPPSERDTAAQTNGSPAAETPDDADATEAPSDTATASSEGGSEPGASTDAAPASPDTPSDPIPGSPAKGPATSESMTEAGPTSESAAEPGAASEAEVGSNGDAAGDDEEPSTAASGTATNGSEAEADTDVVAAQAAAPSRVEPTEQDDEAAVGIQVAPVARPPGASRQRAIRAALRTLPVPEPGPSFWADLDAALAEQGRLAITARPAIRPISEPPPLSQPRLGDRLATMAADEMASQGRRAERDLINRPRTPGKRGLAVAVIAVLVGLFVVGSALGDDSDDTPPSGSSTSTSLAEGEVATTVPGSTTTTVPQVPGLDQATPLSPTGIGPLRVGMTRRQLQEQRIETTVDEASFQSGEGRCFSGAVPVPAASDLVLWFRSPEPDRGVGDPLDGVLAAVSVNALEGSTRPTETGLRLGATVEQVAGAHQGQLDTVPGQAGEQVYLREAPDGSDNGIAYVTDGAVLTKINVGFLDVIPQPETCAV